MMKTLRMGFIYGIQRRMRLERFLFASMSNIHIYVYEDKAFSIMIAGSKR
jgi:hypothetical protein